MLSYLEKSQGKHPKGLICWFQDTCETCHNKRFVYQNSCTNMKFSILMSVVFKLLRQTTGGGCKYKCNALRVRSIEVQNHSTLLVRFNDLWALIENIQYLILVPLYVSLTWMHQRKLYFSASCLNPKRLIVLLNLPLHISSFSWLNIFYKNTRNRWRFKRSNAH